MEAGIHHELSENHMYKNVAYNMFGHRVLSPVCTAQPTRRVLPGGLQIVVTHYFNTEENLE